MLRNIYSHHTDAINFSASAESIVTLQMFQHSIDHSIQYKYLIGGGDSKTFALLQKENVYGVEEDDQVAKLDCIGHVQKRLRTALRILKVQHPGQK